MGRPPTPVGTWGKIGFTVIHGRVRARAHVRDYDGRTRPVTRYGTSKAAAQRRLNEALRDRTGPAGGGRITGETRLQEVAAAWLDDLDASGLAAGTVETYRRTLGNHVLPGLGGLRVCECDVPALERWLRAVRTHHGEAAARNAKSVASLVLALAVRYKALASNPVRDVSRQRKGERSRARALTRDEQVDIVKRVAGEACAAPGSRRCDEADLGDLVELLLGTGCRIGEALAIRRDVVDLDAGVIEVNATVVRIAGKGAVLQERAKSDAGWRVIAVPDQVVELCRVRMAAPAGPLNRQLVWVLSAGGRWRQVPANELGLLFPSIGGGVRNPSNTQRGLRAVLRRISGDYGWVVPHTFRKTVATRLDEAGLTARPIADHLGHARPSMTQDVYMGRGVAVAEAAAVLRRTWS